VNWWTPPETFSARARLWDTRHHGIAVRDVELDADMVPVRGGDDPDTGCVYFVQGEFGGPLKIGSTTIANVRARVGALQTGNPLRLVVRRFCAFGGRHQATAAEREIHTAFSDQRLNGEWFAAVPELASIACAIPDDGSLIDLAAYGVGYRAGRDEGFAAGRADAARRILQGVKDDVFHFAGVEG
jgi:hypothetical protein